MRLSNPTLEQRLAECELHLSNMRQCMQLSLDAQGILQDQIERLTLLVQRQALSIESASLPHSTRSVN